MPRLSDNGAHSIYRVTVRGTDRAYARVCEVKINVKASSPSVAADWVLSYPHLCRVPYSTGSLQVLTAYKLKRQPVWLRKTGTLTARFDVRSIATMPLRPVTATGE